MATKSVLRDRWRTVSRWLLAAIYLLAGGLHLWIPEPFVAIVPDWVPHAKEVVAVTGGCEIAGALCLLVPRLRHLAGIMLALYAVCVVPANINHAYLDLWAGGSGPGWWYHAPRLAFQPVIVWWALFAGAVVDWPFARSGDGRTRP